jgi:hypothetical protein
MTTSQVRRIMAEGIDAPPLTKAQAGETARHVQKIRVNDGPTAFRRRKRKGTK